MPVIREYVSQESAVTDIPSRRLAASDINIAPDNAGRGLMDAGRTLAKIDEEREISDVNVKLAKARSEWTVHLQERAAQADPGDMTFAQSFRTDFAEYLAQTKGTINTGAAQRAFDRGATDLAAHFNERAGVYQIQAAGMKAKQDYLVALDANRNTVLADPTQFESVLRASEAAINDKEGPYARLTGEQRAALSIQTRKEIGLSAAQGVIRMDPELGLKKLQAGDWDAYLDADKKFALEKNAEVAIRGKEIEAERVERAKEKALDKAREATGNALIAKLIKDPTSLSATEIADSNLKWEDKARFNNMLQTAIKPEAIKTDPEVMIKLWERIHLPDGAEGKITREEEVESLFGKGLTLSDVNALRSEIQGRRTDEGKLESDLKENFLKQARAFISDSNQFFKDPKGDENVYKFMANFFPAYLEGRRSGKTAKQLLAPDSPDYLGKDMAKYRRDPKDILINLMEDAKALGAAPAAPGAPVGDAATGQTIQYGGETYEVIGPAMGANGKPLTDGTLRIRDPKTGRTATYRPE